MISDRIVPAHILRLYTWDVLSHADALTLVNGKVPIIPLEDEPELSDAGKPYAVYGYSENDGGRLEQIRQGVFALRVISQSTGDLDRIISIVSRAFESTDIATEALNRFTDAHSADLEGIRFTFARTSFVESADPAETEGGPVEATITISYRYINRLPVPVAESAQGGLWT